MDTQVLIAVVGIKTEVRLSRVKQSKVKLDVKVYDILHNHPGVCFHRLVSLVIIRVEEQVDVRCAI